MLTITTNIFNSREIEHIPRQYSYFALIVYISVPL